MLRLEGMGAWASLLCRYGYGTCRAEEGLLKAASWKEAGPGVGKRGTELHHREEASFLCHTDQLGRKECW